MSRLRVWSRHVPWVVCMLGGFLGACIERDIPPERFGAADECPKDPSKVAPGACGCGVVDTDRDRDGVPDCKDACPEDPAKTTRGTCGCGSPDADEDADGVLDCQDACPSDPAKVDPGVCGCGVLDEDGDADGLVDCIDSCVLGWGRDLDGDQVCDDRDRCPAGDDHADADGDGIADACEGLILWLDADDASTVSSRLCSSAWTPTLDGALLGCWFDKSSAQNHASPSLGFPSSVVVYGQLSGRSVVRLQNARLEGDLSEMPSGDVHHSVFLVARPIMLHDGYETIFQAGLSTSFSALGLNVASHGFKHYFYAADRVYDFTVLDGTAFTLGATYAGQGRTHRLFVNGVEISASNGPVTPLALPRASAYFLGAQHAGYEPYNGDIAELLVFERVITDEEREQITTYLREKWTPP